MCGSSGQALFALIADRVDLSDHPLTDPRGIVRLDHLSDKLVTENARVGIITLHQFEVRTANPRLADLDQGFIRFARLRDIAQ